MHYGIENKLRLTVVAEMIRKLFTILSFQNSSLVLSSLPAKFPPFSNVRYARLTRLKGFNNHPPLTFPARRSRFIIEKFFSFFLFVVFFGESFKHPADTQRGIWVDVDVDGYDLFILSNQRCVLKLFVIIFP